VLFNKVSIVFGQNAPKINGIPQIDNFSDETAILFSKIPKKDESFQKTVDIWNLDGDPS